MIDFKKIFFPNMVSRYIICHYLYKLLYLALGILSLVYLITFVELMRKIDDRDVINLFEMFYLTAAQLGPVIDKILPFLILLASLWSIFSLLKTSELIIFKTSSFSLWRICVIYALTSIVIVAFYVFTLMPILANMHQNYRYWESNRIEILHNIHKKIVLDGRGAVFIKMNAYDMYTHHIKDIVLTFLEDDGLIKKIFFASKGIYDSDRKQIHLKKVVSLKTNQKYLENNLLNKPFILPIDLENLKREKNNKKIMTHIYQYPMLIADQKSQNLAFKNLYSLFYSLLILPITCAIYSIIAVTSVPNLYRGLKIAKNMLWAIASGLFFYIIDSWVLVVSGNSDIPIYVSIFAIKIAVLLLCMIVIFNKAYGFNTQQKSSGKGLL